MEIPNQSNSASVKTPLHQASMGNYDPLAVPLVSTVPEKPKHPTSHKVLLVSAIVILIIGLLSIGGVAIYVNATKQADALNASNNSLITQQDLSGTAVPTIASNITLVPTKSILVKTETVAVDINNNQYKNNDYGFAINFPSHPKGYKDCTSTKADADVQTQIIEDSVNKIVYVAFKTEPMHTTASSCELKNVDLNLIQKGVDFTDGANTTKMYPTSFAFHYNNTANDTELLNFGSKALFNKVPSSTFECKISERTQTDSKGNEFSIKLGSSAQNLEDQDTKCLANFVYGFVYSKSRKLAVAYAIGHDAPFGGDYKLSASFLPE